MQSADTVGSAGRRALWLRLLVVAGAIGAGLWLQHVLALRLEELDALAKTDVLRARAELATLLQVIAVLVFGLTGALGVAIAVSSRRGIALERFPPPGIWSWGGARRVVSGPAARRLGQIGVALGILLFAASAAGGGLLWYMAAVVRACRAGVS